MNNDSTSPEAFAILDSINEIARLTDRNDHTTARRVLAVALGDTEAITVFDFVDGQHRRFGCMPHHVSQIREVEADRLMAKAEQILTADDFSALSMAF